MAASLPVSLRALGKILGEVTADFVKARHTELVSRLVGVLDSTVCKAVTVKAGVHIKNAFCSFMSSLIAVVYTIYAGTSGLRECILQSREQKSHAVILKSPISVLARRSRWSGRRARRSRRSWRWARRSRRSRRRSGRSRRLPSAGSHPRENVTQRIPSWQVIISFDT